MAFPDTDLQVTIQAYMGANPANAPGTWPAATDLSSRLVDSPIRNGAGRSSGQQTASAGSCTFELTNLDGYLTPMNPVSPYYGTWDVGTPVALDIEGHGRVRGYIAELRPQFVPGKGSNWSTVTVTLGGLLRQQTQGSVAKSALTRSLLAGVMGNVPEAVWPLTGPNDLAPSVGVSTIPAVTWGDFLALQQVSLSQGSLAPWHEGGVSLSPGTIVYLNSFVDLTAPGKTPRTVDFLYRVEASGGDQLSVTFRVNNLFVRLMGAATGNVNADKIVLTEPDLSTVSATAPLGTNPLASGDELVHHMRVRFEEVAGNTVETVWIDGVQMVTYTAAGTMGFMSSWQFFVIDEAVLLGTPTVVSSPNVTLGGVWLWQGVEPPSLADTVAAAQGWGGEQAHVRFSRVCAEQGIPKTTTATESRICGPQPIADTVGVLRDLEATDHGILYELPTDWGFGYRAGSQRFNLTAAMTVDLSTYRITEGEAADVLTPVRNDSRLRNEWTISRPNGSTPVTVRDATSQAVKGKLNDSATVNVNSTQDQTEEAWWRLREGTYNGLRYAGMPLDLAANNGGVDGSPNLLGSWYTVVPGDRIDRTNHPTPEMSSETVSQEIEGYSETITRRSWLASLNVEPFEPWRVQQLTATPPADNTLDGWLVPDSLTVGAGLWLPGATGAYASTPNTTDANVASTITIAINCALAAYAGANQTLVSKYSAPANISWRLRINTAGMLQFSWSSDGTSGAETFTTSTLAVPASAGGKIALRVIFDLNNAGVWRARFYYIAGGSDSLGGSAPWVQLGSTNNGVAAATIFSGNASVTVGTRDTGGSLENVTGVIYAATISATGFVAATFTNRTTGTTSWTESGETWTVNGTAFLGGTLDATDTTWLVAISPLMITSASDFPCRVLVEGEEVSVTACAGSVSPQKWTVTRSVNGVAKTHATGTQIDLLDALILTP